MFVAVIGGVALAAISIALVLVIALIRRPIGIYRSPVNTMVVLGSGGHTTEMFRLLTTLDIGGRYKPVNFVVAEDDKMSLTKLAQSKYAAECNLIKIRRSRHVGQSYFSAIFTTLFATLDAVTIVMRLQPDVIICNGPGTCAPVCFIAKLNPLKRTTVVFVESFCRTETLSLTGKILYYARLTDIFMVQWQSLNKKYERTTYTGLLV